MTDTITIPLEEYIQLKVGAERDERFFHWDISENWSDYDNALYKTDEDVVAINQWEADLRKQLGEKYD